MWPVLAPVSFGVRKLCEDVNLFVSLAAAMLCVGQRCSAHWCCSKIQRFSKLTAPIKFFFQHRCPFFFLRVFEKLIQFPVRYLSRFHTFNKLKAHILLGIAKLTYFLQCELSSRVYELVNDTNNEYERQSVIRPLHGSLISKFSQQTEVFPQHISRLVRQKF